MSGSQCLKAPGSAGGYLLGDKHLFWVEGVHFYNPPAYRILLTNNEAPLGKLRLYDPTRRSGPLYHDLATDSWYRNGSFTGELLVDGDLNLEECQQVTFVDHHEKICRSKDCIYRGQKRNVAGARLLAMLIGSLVPNGRDLFLQPTNGANTLNLSAENALSHLIRKVMRHPNRPGPIKAKSSVSPFLATALFARAGTGHEKGLGRLCGLFTNEREMRDALLARVKQYFNLTTLDQFEDLI